MAQPLLKSSYLDPDVLRAEREAIFFKTWQLAGHTSQLEQPGDFITVEVLDQSVLVVRGQDGSLASFYNVCQHRAHALVSGAGHRTQLVCPYHAWTYGLDGSLRTARHQRPGPDFDCADFSLEPVRVDSALGFVFVNLDPEARPLEDCYPGLFADLSECVPFWDQVAVDSRFETTGPDLAANWKVLAENCLECYHCVPAHPAFCDLIDLQSYRCDVHPGWLRSSGHVGRARNKAYGVDPGEPVQDAIYWHLFPNTELIIYPGNAALTTFRFYPLEVARTATSSLMLTRPGDTIAPERLAYRWDVLWPEDESLCRSVQRGLASRGFRHGRLVMSPDQHAVSEHGVAAFGDLWRRAMDQS